MTDRHVRTDDGAVLAVQEHGPADAPVLLLLPGQASAHHWWTGLREDFSPGWRTVTFDYRGTGSTSSPDSAWSTRLFANDAAAVVEAVSDGAVDVYGTSMGGRVAQWLAIDHPQLVRRLVLACTSPGGVSAVERSTEVRRRLAAPDPVARRDALLELMYTPAWRARGRTSNLLGDPTMLPRARALHLRASGTHDASAELARIAAPTLVLHGDDDLLNPVVNARILVDGIPDARLSITRSGRHGFFDEFRTEVSAAVQEFLHEGRDGSS
jgi:3-oxoadipate enol-lactonase